MQRGAHARTAVAELARVLGHLLRELGQVLHARAGGCHQHQRLRGDEADGGEVLHVVLHLLGHQLVDGNLVAGAHQKGVAVGCAARHLLCTNRAACAPNVFNHHRHAQLGAQFRGHGAAGQVGAAPGWVAHHNGDGFGGIHILCERWGRQEGHATQQGGAAQGGSVLHAGLQ